MKLVVLIRENTHILFFACFPGDIKYCVLSFFLHTICVGAEQILLFHGNILLDI